MNFLLIFQIFLIPTTSELTYNPSKSVIIQESNKRTVFIEQTEKVTGSIGIRIPIYKTKEKFNQATNDCNFTVDNLDTLEANTVIKNIIKLNLGLNDDFLTRQDPFGKEKLLIKHTADTSITYKTYENENLKIDENERKLTVIENKVTIRLNENDENENKNNLIDTDMNSIFRFNCKQIERFKIINLTIKKKKH